jgi:PhzF family phenazine biosynthesis protein
VRIFTPGAELPFAGHPTLGSCHAWLEARGTVGTCTDANLSSATTSTSQSSQSLEASETEFFLQECAAGLIRIRRQGTALAFAAPPLQRSQPDPALLVKVRQALGLQSQQILDAQVLDNGPVWLALLLDSAQTVLQLHPDHGVLKTLGQKVGVVAVESEQVAPALISRSNREARAFGTRSSDAELLTHEPHVTVRAFAAPVGVIEDPVTGSLNASLAQWLMAQGHVSSSYVAAQGVCLGRDGRVHIERDAQGQIWVGGDTVTCMEGNITL